MSFTSPCFIRKNTPELRAELRKLGYDILFSVREGYSASTFVSKGVACELVAWSTQASKEYIDCGDNEMLFLALAALRDDTDRNQWFTNGKGDWAQYVEYENPDGTLMCGYEMYNIVSDNDFANFHKATVEEILGWYKNKVQ